MDDSAAAERGLSDLGDTRGKKQTETVGNIGGGGGAEAHHLSGCGRAP